MAGSVRARSFAVSGAYSASPSVSSSPTADTPSSAVPDSTRQASAYVRTMPLAVSELVTVSQSVPASSMR